MRPHKKHRREVKRELRRLKVKYGRAYAFFGRKDAGDRHGCEFGHKAAV